VAVAQEEVPEFDALRKSEARHYERFSPPTVCRRIIGNMFLSIGSCFNETPGVTFIETKNMILVR